MGINFPNSPSAGDTYTYEGETYRYNGVAFVKVRDRVTTFNGATGAIVGVSSVNGLTGSVTLKPSGFEFEILSATLSDVNDDLTNGGIRLVRDYINTTQITFNRFDKQGNDLLYIYVNLLNNGGTIYGISEDGEKFFHIVSPDRDIRSGHSFLLLPNSSISTGKLQFQDTTSIPSDGAPDDGLIAMESFSAGTKVFVNFIPNIAPPTTIDGISGPIVLASTLELGGPSGATLDINVDNLAVVRSFNGATGAIDTTSLVLPVTGLSASSGITLSGDLSIAGDIISQDNNLAIRGPGGSEIMMSFLGSQTIINNSAVNQDIIVKGNGDSQLFVTDAGNNRVGIGTSTPTEKLDVDGTIKAATGITLGAGGITFSDGTFQPTAARSGFRYKSISSGSGLGTPSSGTIDIDNVGEVDKIQINMTDKEGNNLAALFQQLKDNGGYLEIMTGDFSQALVLTIESQKDDDNIVSMGETTVTPGDTISTVQTISLIEQGLDLQNIEDIYMRVIPNSSNFIREFNGITGSVDTTSLVLPVAGISGPSGITFSNGEQIRNNPDGSIQIIPSDEGGNHYGIEIDATEWGFGPTITAIEEDGTQSSASIRFDSDLVMGIDADGTSSRLQFSTNGDRAFQKLDHNDGTVMFGVNDNNGHFAVGRKAELNNANRSMSTSDKTALGMNDPQFLVYSADGTDANDYVRIEHDQTDANIFSGNGGINLVPLSGAVGISGGGLNVGTNGITFGDDTTQKTATKDVGTFTISASSAISTGAKADALHRIPYNATLTKFELKSKATGGMTAAVYIAGADFGNLTNAFITGATAETTGFTADTTTFGTATVSEGDFVYLHVLANASGATAAQAFISYETR